MPFGTEKWEYIRTASWRQPLGDGSTVDRFPDHPVVHVSYSDALAYTSWRAMDLPTEEEWEHAARGGLANNEFAWGNEPISNGSVLANFRHTPMSLVPDIDAIYTTPVGSFPPNGFRLCDLIGNVWEWTKSSYTPNHLAARDNSNCCVRAEVYASEAQVCIKGGSFLCSPDYCKRYRPAARQGVDMSTMTNHLGFRCVKRR